MDNSLWNKKIPTLLGAIMLAVGLGVTSYLAQTGVIFEGRAALSDVPENVRITNVSDSSFSVTYTTTKETVGSISVGKTDNLDSTYADDRDQEADTIHPYTTHSFTVQGLSPQTEYLFLLSSGGTKYQDDGQPFRITTGPKISTEPFSHQPTSGKIVTDNGQPASGTLVFLVAPGSQTLSMLTKADGSFILPLNGLRGENLASYQALNDDTPLSLLAVTSTQTSNVELIAKDRSPIPIISLARDYDFAISLEPTASSSGDAIGFPAFTAAPLTRSAEILSPDDDETFVDQQPVFEGTAAPGANVKVIIHSTEEITSQVQSDSRGRWTFRPSQPLSPGEHSITIITQDKFGILKSITKSFTVHAQGSQVNQTATPSATPKLTPAPTTKLLSLTPTVAPTTKLLSPTPVILSPSPTPLLALKITPTPIESGPTKAIQPTLPPTGNSTLVLTGVGAAITTGVGILLFLLTRGNIPL